MKTHQLLVMFFVALVAVSATVGCASTQKTSLAADSTVAVQKHASANTPEGVWAQMVSHLRAGDVPGAVFYYSIAAKDKYQEAFSSLSKAELNSMAQDLGTIKESSLKPDSAEYYFERPIGGQMIAFPVEFDKEDGQWKIMEF